jgi:hypothetical protein
MRSDKTIREARRAIQIGIVTLEAGAPGPAAPADLGQAIGAFRAADGALAWAMGDVAGTWAKAIEELVELVGRREAETRGAWE